MSRVLHLYAGNLYGGIERLLDTLARLRHLAPDMEPEFGLCFRGRMWDELATAGMPLHDLGAVRISRPWTVLRARRTLKAVLKQRQYDAVVCHACWPHVVFAPAVRAAGVRLINWVHGELNGQHWIERWARRTPPDAVIVNSDFTAKSLSKVFPNVPSEVVYIPVECNRVADRSTNRASVRAELNTPDDAVVILLASRLERLKGIHVLIEALGKLAGLPGWVAWIAGGSQKPGEQDYFQELQHSAKQLGVADRIRFLGQRTDVAKLMASADIYCQPNTQPEGFGLTFIEALAAGLPVMTSNIGGGQETINATCGILTKPNDPESVAKALETLIMNPSERQRLGEAGPGRARSLCDPTRQLPAISRAIFDPKLARV